MITINFKPQKVTKSLISGLNERAQDVLSQRFGLGDSLEKKTLEAIGQQYGITRERVRQIENFAVSRIKQCPSFKSAESVFAEIKNAVESNGKIISEEDILDCLSKKDDYKNHIHFFLVLGDDFIKFKEDDHFYSRWTTDKDYADRVHVAIKQLHKEVSKDDLLSEEEMVSLLKANLEKEIKDKITDEIIRSWLNLSKKIDRNPLNEWGHVYSTNISPRGMRDYAFLVLRKHGSPLHFTEIAEKISEYFPRKANASTVHNELIKDGNFVLVGRGLYALSDWGYKTGAVRDVIKTLIGINGPMTKDEIIKAVLKERYIKENTILVNLQNRHFFKRNSDNKYVIVA